MVAVLFVLTFLAGAFFGVVVAQVFDEAQRVSGRKEGKGGKCDCGTEQEW